MAPSNKTASMAKDRRKSSTVTAAATTSNGAGNGVTSSGSTADSSSSNGPRQMVTLTVTPQKLRAIVDPKSLEAESLNGDAKAKESPSTSVTLPVVNSNGDNGSDSNSNTPATGTPAPPSVPMGPPPEGPKKKGSKRGAGAMMNGEPKVRGKPGPKKKMKLDDGTVEVGRANGLGSHKLGPKANMGAINAGLRALDRSGKPCRKWTKAGFTLKSFTGVVWEIHRWSAPPKAGLEEAVADKSATASAADSGKENNKDSPGQLKSEHSNNGVDMEMHSVPSIGPVVSPTTPAIAAA